MHIKPSEEGVAALAAWYNTHFVYARITGDQMADAKYAIRTLRGRRIVPRTPVHALLREYELLVEEGVLPDPALTS